MSLQHHGCREVLLTQKTPVVLLASVCADVHIEVGGAPEPLLAVGAGVRSFFCVDPFVEEFTRGEEGLPALGALMWPLSCVSQVMPDKRSRLGKPLPTLGARKWVLSCVGVDVCALRSLALKALGALWTPERPEVTVTALFSQVAQKYGLSPVWIRSWRLRLASCTKLFSQWEHWEGCWPL